MADLSQVFTALASEHALVGGQVSLQGAGARSEAAYGVLSTRTRVPATVDTVFQIGSITKVWTAVLALQEVEAGRLSLDQPIRSYLPGFRVQDEVVSKRMTARHLLTHTSGIDGDYFIDTGRGDDALAVYVTRMRELRAIQPLGELFSYCNTGFSLLGHALAVMNGTTWENLIAQRVIGPLGLPHAGTLPEQALLQRAAVGHVPTDGALAPVPVWGLPRGCGPAGAVHATTSEVLDFASEFFAGAHGGRRLLSDASAVEMTTGQVPFPASVPAQTSMGLGWMIGDWNGARVLAHDGATLGQRSYLRVFPDHGVALALSANGGDSDAVFRDVLAEFVTGRIGVAAPEPPVPDGSSVDPDVIAPWLGRYERAGWTVDLELGDGGLTATMTYDETFPVVPKRSCLEILPSGPSLYAARAVGSRGPCVATVFHRLSDGSRQLAIGMRAAPQRR